MISQTDEAVHCVISIGKANLPAFAPKRKELDKVCGMDEEQLAQLGAWQKEAVLAARLAPSAINQQPWKIAADKTSVSILETTVLYKKYAPLDRGICMLHAAVGAAKAGRTGHLEKGGRRIRDEGISRIRKATWRRPGRFLYEKTPVVHMLLSKERRTC